MDADSWRKRIGKFNSIKTNARLKTCPSNLDLLILFKLILHVVLDSLTFQLLVCIFASFYYCVVILSAFGITLCFMVYLRLMDIMGSVSVSSNFLCNMALSFSFLLARSPTTYLVKVIFLVNNFLYKLRIVLTLLVSSGSVETNPGPFIDTYNTLSFATWNLDSLPAREFSRISVIESLQAVLNSDIFAVCESSLHEHIPNENISIHGFPLIHTERTNPKCS